MTSSLIKIRSRSKKATRAQFGAIPYRISDTGDLEILLVTTRSTGRWMIPKGWPIEGLTGPESAKQEAFEEAGVRGTIADAAIGSFTYLKLLDELTLAVQCNVTVYPLLVKKQFKAWPEKSQRKRKWFEARLAMTMVTDLKLGRLILKLYRSLR